MVDVEPDGLAFDPGSVRVTAIRPEDAYGGQRVRLVAYLGKGRLRVQVDVGFGDAVFPEPVILEYPTLLAFPKPRLRAYRPETMIAEKVHAMIELGSRNSRMRDFFDIRALALHRTFEGNELLRAVRRTFARRQTTLPETLPLPLTPTFAALEGKQSQWSGFIRRSRLSGVPEDLMTVVGEVAEFIAPVLEAPAGRGSLPARWERGGPWR